jgi:hypothetical protein
MESRKDSPNKIKQSKTKTERSRAADTSAIVVSDTTTESNKVMPSNIKEGKNSNPEKSNIINISSSYSLEDKKKSNIVLKSMKKIKSQSNKI